jgi:integrase
MRSIFINGKEVRKSLGHRDRELAKKQAYELVTHLMADERAIENESVTLGMLMRLYVESPAFMEKKERTRDEDGRRLERVVTFLCASREVGTLSESDVRRFTAARRRGDPSLIGVKPNVAVRDRSVQADLVALHTMLNWSAKERDSRGRRLATENPLRGIAIPREKNPRRPLMSHPEFEKLLLRAGEVSDLLVTFLTLSEATGRRLSACRQLRWEDLDLTAGTVHWRADTDKKGYDVRLPLPDAVRDALARWQTVSGGIGRSWVFPSPSVPSEPISRHLLDDWLRRAYRMAGIEPKRGGMWHPIRRKFATERKGHSAVDVAAYGGWRDLRTVQTIYQQPDVESMRLVAAAPTHRVSAAV